MRKILSLAIAVVALTTLSACSSNPSKPRLSAGASHSQPLTVGSSTSAWLMNAVRVYPWSKGRKVRVSSGILIKPTPNTNADISIDW
ncbi:MAG: hypothetical protein Q4G44_07310 [Alcaligenaceae bacterium]|nr:hypothetical protein [Alcaligenaceae bacterium]